MKFIWDTPGLTWDQPGLTWDGETPDLTIEPRRHMASNALPDTISNLLSLGHDCADGAHQFEAAIPLLTNTESAIGGDVAALELKVADFAAFDMVMPGVPDLDTEVQKARSNARAFLTLVRDNLKGTVGPK